MMASVFKEIIHFTPRLFDEVKWRSSTGDEHASQGEHKRLMLDRLATFVR